MISISYSVDPSAYLIESASESYFANGSLKTPLSSHGSLEIELPNTRDVLQYIRINLTSNYDENTNLLSRQSFADVAASPTVGDRTSMSFDTDEGYTAYYRITDPSLIPFLNITINYENELGGRDVVEGIDNVIDFDIAIQSGIDINDVEIYISILHNSYFNDSIELGSLQATSWTILKPLDMDVDGNYDRLRWVGDLKADTPVHITFIGTTRSDENYDPDDQAVIINEDDSITATYEQPYTFSGMTIEKRFAKGPVREGVKLIFRDTVFVRGTITNKAEELRYSLTDWSIYNVSDLQNSMSSGTVPDPQELGPGEAFNSDWLEASTESENYYVPEFNWQVKWGPSTYSRSYYKGIELPILYQADAVQQNSLSFTENTTDRMIYLYYSIRNLGHIETPFDYFNTLINISEEYDISEIHVYYSNETMGGSTYDITSHAQISVESDIANITISDIHSALGKYLSQNEDIHVSINATGNYTRDAYTFGSSSTATVRTLSGTPISLFSAVEYFMPGYVEPLPPTHYYPPGGSGNPNAGAAIPYNSDYAAIEKSSSSITGSVNSDSAYVESVFHIIDNGDKGVGDVYSTITLPAGSSLEAETVTVSVFDNSRQMWIEYPRSNIILKEDPEKKDSSLIYKVLLKSDSWDDEYKKLTLNDDDLYSISYSASLPKGQNKLITSLVGFNYYTDDYMSKDIESFIAINIDRSSMQSLTINETEFRHQQIVVGSPVRWLKTIDVYNPNNSTVAYTFRPMLFSDILTTHISSKTEISHEIIKDTPLRAQFKDTFDPSEYKTYLVDVTTSPILIKDEKYSVDESADGKRLQFKTVITLENPSSLSYENIHLPYDIPFENVISVNEGLIPLEYEAIDESSIRVIIPSLKGKKTTELTLEYLKTPPVLITRTDKPYYSAGDRVNISVIFIPASDMRFTNLEIEVLSDGENPDTIYSEIVKVKDLKENLVHTISRDFTIPDTETGMYFVRVQASLSPLGEISSTSEFALESSTVSVARKSLWPTIAMFGLLVIMYLVRRIYRQRRFTQELDTLRKEIEDLD